MEGRKAPSGTEEKARLALGLALLSPGIPMLSAGQDFLRGKKGGKEYLPKRGPQCTGLFRGRQIWRFPAMDPQANQVQAFARRQVFGAPKVSRALLMRKSLTKRVGGFGLVIRENDSGLHG